MNDKCISSLLIPYLLPYTVSFDLEYRKSYSKLSNKQLSQLHVNDRPPAEGAVFCRRYFKDLELKVE